MPNWVSNIVKVEGLSEKDLFTKYEDGSVGFDFNKLIPMPPELDVADGGITDVAIDSVISLFGYKPRSPWYDKSVEQFVKEGRFQELLNQGLQYITNRVKYGATTWYDWCNHHWNTKWNACYTKHPSPDVVYFDTAWSTPDPIIKELSILFPEKSIHHWFFEESGAYSGYEITRNGVVVYSEIDDPGSEAMNMRYGFINSNGNVLSKWGVPCPILYLEEREYNPLGLNCVYYLGERTLSNLGLI